MFFDLSFIDWDHSLLMAVVWSLAWSALFLKNPRLAWLAGAAAFSHFLADFPVHNHDLAVLPFAETHLGLSGWGRLGTGAWILEGVFTALLCAYVARLNARRGVRSLATHATVALLFVALSPWLSPMKPIATLPEPAAHLLHGALVALGFLLPGLALSSMCERAERRATV